MMGKARKQRAKGLVLPSFYDRLKKQNQLDGDPEALEGGVNGNKHLYFNPGGQASKEEYLEFLASVPFSR